MSLRASLQSRIVDDMVGAVCGEGERVVLVLDQHTAKVISSCMRATELINHGIIAIEAIACRREPLPSFGAIYFLDPTPESARRLIDDFKDKPQYKEAHVFFTRAIPDAVMDMFSGQKIVRRSKCLVELNVDFTAREDRVFTLSRPNTLPTLFWSSDKESFNNEILSSARQLVSLCVTLSDDPAIRYDSRSRIAKILAKTVDQQLNFTKENARWHGKTHGSMLIVDRAVDILTPLMHEFTYQALVHDVCGNHGELCFLSSEDYHRQSSEEKAKRTMILNEGEDPLWRAHRHDHIGTVMSEIPAQLKAFKKENKLAKMEDERAKAAKAGTKPKDVSVKDMAAALKDFNAYSATLGKFAQHTALSAECMKKIDAHLLKEIGDLEQDFATGYDEQGEAMSVKRAKSSLISLCQNPKLGVEERLRLVLVYMLTQGGVQASTRRELMRGIPEQCLGAVTGLEQLGIKFTDEKFKGTPMESSRRKEGQKRVENIVLLRYVPLLWQIAKELAEDKLSTADFPYVSEKQRDEPGGGAGALRTRRNKRDKSGASGSSKGSEVVEPHFIVFVAGGLTYSEAREINILADALRVNLIVGGTDLINARDFLASAGNMSLDAWQQAAGEIMGPVPTEVPLAGAPKAKPAPAAAAAAPAAKSASKYAEDPEDDGKGKKGAKGKKKRADDSDDDDEELERPDF